MSTCNPVSGCSGTDNYNTGGEVCQFSDLYQYMMPELPSCPSYLILQELRKTARRFCEEEIWIENLSPINLKQNKRRYEMDIDYCARIKRIKSVEYKTQDQVDNGYEGRLLTHWDYEVEIPFDLILKFYPQEDVKKGLIVRAVLYPEFDSDSISREFMNEWQEGLLAGAMAELLKMPNKRWTDITQAQIYNNDYKKWVNLAVQERMRQHKDADLCFSA